MGCGWERLLHGAFWPTGTVEQGAVTPLGTLRQGAAEVRPDQTRTVPDRFCTAAHWVAWWRYWRDRLLARHLVDNHETSGADRDILDGGAIARIHENV